MRVLTDDSPKTPTLRLIRSVRQYAFPLVNQSEVGRASCTWENNLTVGAFIPERVNMLRVLSAQIAISLQNALLYRKLKQEITERKSTEMLLRHSERQFRALFENAPLCLFELDVDQVPPVLVRANRQAEKVYGWQPESLMGETGRAAVSHRRQRGLRADGKSVPTRGVHVDGIHRL